MGRSGPKLRRINTNWDPIGSILTINMLKMLLMAKSYAHFNFFEKKFEKNTYDVWVFLKKEVVWVYEGAWET